MTGGGIDVGVDEAADLGIIITALQIIEPGILGMELAILTLLTQCSWFLKTKIRSVICGCCGVSVHVVSVKTVCQQ